MYLIDRLTNRWRRRRAALRGYYSAEAVHEARLAELGKVADPRVRAWYLDDIANASESMAAAYPAATGATPEAVEIPVAELRGRATAARWMAATERGVLPVGEDVWPCAGMQALAAESVPARRAARTADLASVAAATWGTDAADLLDDLAAAYGQREDRATAEATKAATARTDSTPVTGTDGRSWL